MAVALKALKFGTFGLRRGRRLYGWVEHGLFDGVETRGRDDTLIGLDGLKERNRRVSRREIEVAINVRGMGATEADRNEDFATLQQEIEVGFGLEARANLEAVLRDGRIFTIRALPLNIGYDELNTWFAKCSIILESVVPIWTET